MSIVRRFAQFRGHVSRAAAPEPAPEPPRAAPEDGPARPALVCGLGNPGAQYAATRHNVGAWCIDLLARRHGVALSRSGRVEGAHVVLDGRPLLIARPRSFMNESGPPIATELKRAGLRPPQLLVIYDDLDLPVGRVRMRLQGSSGGNNGLKSIIASLGGSIEFPRIRIGIDRPYDAGIPVRDPDRVAAWVLSRPQAEHRRLLEAAVERVADAVEQSVRDGYEVAMNELNRWEAPSAP